MPTRGREDGVVHALCCPSAKVPPPLSWLQHKEPEKLPSTLQHPLTSYLSLRAPQSWKTYVCDFSPVKVKGSFPAGSFLCNKVQLWKEPAPRWSSTCKHSWGAGHSTGRRGPIKEPAHPGSGMLPARCPPPQGNPAP